MKLYLISGTYFGTQAEAKPAAVEAGIKVSAIGEHEVEVPTDKAGLIAYLNHMAEGNFGSGTIVEERVGAKLVSIDLLADTGRVEYINTSINVEDEIANADFPTALRLAEHATSRVGEHLKAIADAHLPKPASGYQKPGGKSLDELLS